MKYYYSRSIPKKLAPYAAALLIMSLVALPGGCTSAPVSAYDPKSAAVPACDDLFPHCLDQWAAYNEAHHTALSPGDSAPSSAEDIRTCQVITDANRAVCDPDNDLVNGGYDAAI